MIPNLIIFANMERQLKLIWDFRGTFASKTAEHHEIHLKEYIQSEKILLNITGFQMIDEMHAIAYMVVPESQMIAIRDALKPHRGEVYLNE
jgi:hypothetical protein